MSATIAVEKLRVGMFVHLDLGWWAHPFALSSFKLQSADQIATIRGLGLTQVRWSPERSDPLDEEAAQAAPAPAPAEEPGPITLARAEEAATAALLAEEAASAERQRCLAQQREAARLCEQQYAEARQSWRQASERVLADPGQARQVSEGLTRALVDKMLEAGELCIRVLNDPSGDRASAHAMNVALLSLLMARGFGFSAEDLFDLGLGSLLHDIGKLELPERLHLADAQFSSAELAAYRDHVARGVAQGKRMGLSTGALLVIAQHHEMADGSGFPQKLNVDRMGVGSRIVSLVNRYDNLCNPRLPAQALTPHEALSMIFAQSRDKFDAALLNSFIRMMGVYPPGSAVQLTDDRYALVMTVNSSRPLKPRVLVHEPAIPVDQALHLDLETQPDLGIRRSLKLHQLPQAAVDYLAPRQRIAYFFEPALRMAAPAQAGAGALGALAA
jgi:HD-GYP domain-containing protein (c-di-GMP phosphodiesterase class II)